MIKNKFFIATLLIATVLAGNVKADQSETFENEDGTYTIVTRNKYETWHPNFAFTIEQRDENGKTLSKEDYIVTSDGGCPFCFSGESEMFDDFNLFTSDWDYFLKNEYEYDNEGNLVARWENNVETKRVESCWEENEDEIICEWDDQIIGSYSNKYDAEDNLIGKYSSKGGDLIEAYQEETPQVVKELKRIYTVEEASKLVKPSGNTFKIRYK